MHADGKAWALRTSKIDSCRDVLHLTSKQASITLTPGKDPSEKPAKELEDARPYGDEGKRKWNQERQELKQVRKNMGEPKKRIVGQCRTYKGIVLGGKKVHVGGYLEIEDRREKGRINGNYSNSDDMNVWLGKLLSVRRVIFDTTEKEDWARLQVMRCMELKDKDLRCPVFKVGRVAWIPLGRHDEVFISARPQVLVHPLHPNLACRNIWVHREHSSFARPGTPSLLFYLVTYRL